MTREELERFIEKHDARADHYYQRYQESGMTIDDRRRRESEGIADIARIALSAHDDYQQLIELRIQVADWAFRAQKALRGESPTQILFEMVRYAESRGLIKPDLYDCDPDKNQECRKTGCFRNGGECSQTVNPEYRRDA